MLSLSSGERVIFVALPLQTVRRVQGALLITAGTDDIDRSVRDVRFALVIAFLAALLITILLSLYLARTITRPVKRLAQAADAVSAGLGKKSSIPDFGNRRDEIGNLSISLTTMTDTLWSRMEAIENFVADVAHEIKNPLTSLRSAVEAMRRIKDKNKREELLDIITADVVRLDKLLSEIAEASRIDTELSRLDPKPLNISKMLETLLALHQYQLDVISPKKIKVLIDKDETYFTLAVADRMAQVFQNLIDNALSFSPPNGTVTISVARNNEWIEMCVSDNGPGVPNDSLERIFERFYTYRNKNNTFGSHSGLGLAISRQIVSRYGGSIICTNLNDDSGAIVGARLKVKLVSLIPNTKK